MLMFRHYIIARPNSNRSDITTLARSRPRYGQRDPIAIDTLQNAAIYRMPGEEAMLWNSLAHGSRRRTAAPRNVSSSIRRRSASIRNIRVPYHNLGYAAMSHLGRTWKEALDAYDKAPRIRARSA